MYIYIYSANFSNNNIIRFYPCIAINMEKHFEIDMFSDLRKKNNTSAEKNASHVFVIPTNLLMRKNSTLKLIQNNQNKFIIILKSQ